MTINFTIIVSLILLQKQILGLRKILVLFPNLFDIF